MSGESESVLRIKLLTEGKLDALKEARAESESLNVSLEVLRSTLGLLGASLGLGSLVEGTRAMVEYGASLKHLSEQAGISTDAFQTLGYAAVAAGLKQEELGTSLNVLQRNLAQAADGATKQNKAIADLGLNTAELLAMPMEQQIQAIATAYVNATNKGKAWADVTALLGRNSARLKEVLQQLGTSGLAGVDAPFKISDADIDRLEKTEKFWGKLWMEVKAVAGMAVARPLDALLAAGSPGGGAQFIAGGVDTSKAEPSETPEEHAAKVAQIQADLDAPRLKKEAEDAAKANELAGKYAAAEIELTMREAQEKTKLLPIGDQLNQASEHAFQIEQAMASLDTTSNDYQAQHLRLRTQLLAVEHEISNLKERDAVGYVGGLQKGQELQNKREMIALAAIEHDFTKSDVEKWDEKRSLLIDTLNRQKEYVITMQALAGSPNVAQGARDKAGQAAATGENAVAGTEASISGMGPNPHSFTQNLSKDLTGLQNQWRTLQQNMASGLTGVISSGFSSLSREISKAITGAESFGQAIRNIATDIEDTLVQAIVEMGVQWLAQEAMRLIFGNTAKKSDTITTEEAALAAAQAWATPAAMASVASYGAADLAGMAGLTGAVLSAHALALGGFAGGGYTGGSEGNVAGVVHGAEFVWSAPAVRAVGADNLERAHQAALAGGGGGGGAAGGGGANVNLINAYSAGDVARAQRKYVDARVLRGASVYQPARVAL